MQAFLSNLTEKQANEHGQNMYLTRVLGLPDGVNYTNLHDCSLVLTHLPACNERTERQADTPPV